MLAFHGYVRECSKSHAYTDFSILQNLPEQSHSLVVYVSSWAWIRVKSALSVLRNRIDNKSIAIDALLGIVDFWGHAPETFPTSITLSMHDFCYILSLYIRAWVFPSAHDSQTMLEQ